MSTSPLIDDFVRELQEAAAAARSPEAIVVTTDALRGSITTVPVVRDHDSGERWCRELRVHPLDWRDLLVDLRNRSYIDTTDSAVTRVLGVPVRR